MVTKKNTVRLPGHDEVFEIKLLIWDIAGQKIVTMVHQAYYTGAEAAIVVADITRRSTFNSMKSWVEELRRTAGDVPVILAYNKTDLEDKLEITPDEMEEKAAEIGAGYLLTSAKDGSNVEKAFDTICSIIAERAL